MIVSKQNLFAYVKEQKWKSEKRCCLWENEQKHFFLRFYPLNDYKNYVLAHAEGKSYAINEFPDTVYCAESEVFLVCAHGVTKKNPLSIEKWSPNWFGFVMVQPFLGENLKDYVRRQKPQKNFFRKLAESLQHLTREREHGNLKPENIFVDISKDPMFTFHDCRVDGKEDVKAFTKIVHSSLKIDFLTTFVQSGELSSWEDWITVLGDDYKPTICTICRAFVFHSIVDCCPACLETKLKVLANWMKERNIDFTILERRVDSKQQCVMSSEFCREAGSWFVIVEDDICNEISFVCDRCVHDPDIRECRICHIKVLFDSRKTKPCLPACPTCLRTSLKDSSTWFTQIVEPAFKQELRRKVETLLRSKVEQRLPQWIELIVCEIWEKRTTLTP